jgi:acyl dehydratase
MTFSKYLLEFLLNGFGAFHKNTKTMFNEILKRDFIFTQDDVIAFAKLTGDNNPVHLDAEYAATTQFKRPIIHGHLSSSIFTKVLGTEFPGFGSIYLKQETEFLRPMFVNTEYEAVFQIKSVNAERHTAEMATDIFDKTTGKQTIRGVATMMNKEKF